MVQGIESNSNVISPQEMHQKVQMQKMYTYDKDSKCGISQAELKNYISDVEFGGGQAPEFAQKLMEKFGEVDQNKDGQLSATEIGSLTNNRGLWSVNPLQTVAASQVQSNVSASRGVTGLLNSNIQSLVNKGISYAKNNPQLMNKIGDMAKKIV